MTQHHADTSKITGESHRAIFVVAAMPPPVHGQSVMNLIVADSIRNYSPNNLTISNIAPSSSNILVYHLSRISRVTIASLRILFSPRRRISVYSVYESGFGFLYNLLILISARVRMADVFIHHHTSEHCKRHSKRFAVVNWMAGVHAKHIVLSDQMKSDLQDTYGTNLLIRVVNNGSCLSGIPKIDPNHKIFDGSISLGHLSNLTPEKGVADVLSIFSELRSRGCPVRLELAGPTADPSIEKAIAEFSALGDNYFRYWGPVFGERKADFLSKVDIFLFPSRYKYEAQPLVLLESMAYGAFCIAYEAGYIPELLSSTGFLACNREEIIDFLSSSALTPTYLIGESGRAIASSLQFRTEGRRQLELLIEDICNKAQGG
ncbi:glycosyltransferase family 4 protein [Aquabacterium sp.]|uniref:glycosyltransferase family 4 protein n=1 Tax=Aquabacterium sp. TaxID=1872578 RepID=UPI0035B37AC2